MTFDKLKAGPGGIESLPEQAGQDEGKSVETEGDGASMAFPPGHGAESSGDWEEDEQCDQASHA
jgi:hypothetical protein